MAVEIKRILLGLAGGQHDRQCCEFAFDFAARVDARVVGHLIRPLADDPGVLMASGFIGEAFKQFVESAEQTVSELRRAAGEALSSAAAKHPGVPFVYEVPKYGDDDELATQGWASDLIVMPHPALMKVRYYRRTVEHTIANSGRPVLLLPESFDADITRHIVFVSGNDAQTAKAMALSLGILKLAGKVTLVTGDEVGSATEWAGLAATYLAAHGVATEAHPFDGSQAEVDRQIFDFFAAAGGTLLVGAVVVPSEIREFFFDGAIARALAVARGPMLLVG